MEWFRNLLTEKARTFQIIVFTCRPADYLDAATMVEEEGPGYLERGRIRERDRSRAGGGAVGDVKQCAPGTLSRGAPSPRSRQFLEM
jgi:hypothetical protein